jgi:transcriptional regulator with XRE-family HTH domain
VNAEGAGSPGQLAVLLRSHREAAGLRQRQLATHAGISVGALQDVEQGRTTRPYTIDASTGHLQETYLPATGGWHTQDLSANYDTPASAETPAALLHPDTTGALTWTSVYTIDESDGHLQETYLPALGDPWVTQDLSHLYGTPPST